MAQDKYFQTSEGSVNIACVLDEAVTNAYTVAKIATDGDVGIADSGSDNIIGVITKEGASGDIRNVRIQGVTLGRIASGSINAGVIVTAASGGYVASASDGNFVLGKTLAQATGVDSVVPVIIIPGCPQIEDVA